MGMKFGVRFNPALLVAGTLIIDTIEPGSVAEELGILSGDQLLALEPGGPLKSEADFAERLSSLDDDSTVACQVLREGHIVDLTERNPRVRVDESLVTTLAEIPGYRTVKILGVVTAIDSNAGWTARTKGRRAFASAAGLLLAEAESLGGNAVLGMHVSAFAAGGGITNVLGGDAVGVALYGTAAVVEPAQ